MKVIIAGSRTIHDMALLEEAIATSKFKITQVVSGGAIGVDRLGLAWAQKNSIATIIFRPNWALGPSGGPRRNEEMGDHADALIAVWDGYSRGTKHIIEYMGSLGKPVFVQTPKPPPEFWNAAQSPGRHFVETATGPITFFECTGTDDGLTTAADASGNGMPETGGSFGGAGASASWEAPDTNSSDSSPTDSGSSDSGSCDSGSSDSGSSCGGGE